MFFRTQLHRKIYGASFDFELFLITQDQASILFPEEEMREKPLLIWKRYFKLMGEDAQGNLYLVLLKRKNIEPKMRIEGTTVLLNAKPAPIMDLTPYKFEGPKLGDSPVVIEKIKVGEGASGSEWWHENFLRYSQEEPKDSKAYESFGDMVSKGWTLKDFLEESDPNQFWFTLDKRYTPAEAFWRELREYYQTETLKKIHPLTRETAPPIFTRNVRQHVDLVELQRSIAQRIQERLQSLRENNEKIGKQLKECEGVAYATTEEQDDFRALLEEQRLIGACLERTHESLDHYATLVDEAGEETHDLLNKPIVDMGGNPMLISRYYDQITERLLDLNMEINAIQKSHLEIEKELIRRLKSVADVKALGERLAQLDQERELEEFKEKRRLQEERRRKLEAHRDLGKLNESAVLMQKRIEEEKARVDNYLENLKNLAAYDDFANKLLEHRETRQQHGAEMLHLRREALRLKGFLSRRERKYDDFFEGVNDEISLLREDVSEARWNNSSLERRCVENWRSRWEKEGAPMVDSTFARNSRIVEAFAPIPPIQIVKVSQLKEKLKREVNARKSEWQRVYEEIRREFREMNYELSAPMESELDTKYLDRLDDALLTLSNENKKTIFPSPTRFQLSNLTDERIGLSPRILDDDKFEVIDQVWEELTPEQERELEEKLKRDRSEDLKRKKEELAREQLAAVAAKAPRKAKLYGHLDQTSKTARAERYGEMEKRELQLWKGDNYLIPNSRGEFKELLFEITKRLFSTRSVRSSTKGLELTDTGLVEDGNTTIFTPKDYFIKPGEGALLSEADQELDLSESGDIHREPDKEMLEIISDPSHVAHARELEERSATPPKPTALEWAQIFLKEYRREREKTQDVERLRGLVLEMQDEVKALQKYHQAREKELERALKDKEESFDELKGSMEETRGFLRAKDEELRNLMESTDRNVDEALAQRRDELLSKKKKIKEKKQGIFHWLNRLIYGPEDDEAH